MRKYDNKCMREVEIFGFVVAAICTFGLSLSIERMWSARILGALCVMVIFLSGIVTGTSVGYEMRDEEETDEQEEKV